MTDMHRAPTTTTRVEWRVESETTEDDFGADEARAREWLAECQRNVAAGRPHWEPAVLLSRTVTITESPWEPVPVPAVKRPRNAKPRRGSA